MQTQTFAPNPKLNDCIRACNDTRDAALRTLAWVTSDGFDEATPEFVRLLSGCAEICQTAANFMLRGSELHHHTCKSCEEVCEAVYEACEQSGLDEIEDFKEQVQSCAEHCREMANAGEGTSHEGNVGQRAGRGTRRESPRSTGTQTEGARSRTSGRQATKGARSP